MLASELSALAPVVHPVAPSAGRAEDRSQRLLRELRQAFGADPFHVDDAARCGILHDRLVRACTAGLVDRVGRGWYAVAHDASRDRARLEVLQAENPGVVACGVTAAAIWGLPVPPGRRGKFGSVEVAFRLGSPGLRGRRPDVFARRWFVPDTHVCAGPDGVPVTDPLRTAIDLARGRSLAFALGPLDAAVRLLVAQGTAEGTAREALKDRCDDLARGHGIRAAVHALGYVDPLAESLLESLVRGRIIEARLPVPRLQVPVHGWSGRSYRADMGLDLPGRPRESYGLLIEADGLGKYDTPQALAEEKKRQHDLEREGYEFVRALYREAVMNPEPFLTEIRRLLAR